jgi:hypothetical protein
VTAPVPSPAEPSGAEVSRAAPSGAEVSRAAPSGAEPHPDADRPWPVTVAVAALLAAAAGALLAAGGFGGELLVQGPLVDRAAAVTGADPGDVAAERIGSAVLFGLLLLVSLVAALGLGGVALWAARPGAAGRLAACATAGAVLLCCCGGVGVAAFAASTPAAGETAFTAELSRLEAAETPGWVTGLLAAGVLLTPAASLAALTVLALPAASRYYRRAAAAPGPLPGVGWPTPS